MDKEKPGYNTRELVENPEAFGRIYDEHRSRIYTYIASRVNSIEDAEDMTSRTFEKALRNLRSYRPERASMTTWLFRIANNVVIDHYRREATRKNVDKASLKQLYETDRYAEDDVQRLESLVKLFRELPESYQEVLTLKFLEGLSNQEIAQTVCCSHKTLSMKIHRALKALRKLQVKYKSGEPDLYHE